MNLKQLLIVFAFIVLPVKLFAQFPGEKIYVLLNTEVEVAPKEQSQQQYGYDRFFVDETLKLRYISKSGPTPYDSLVGKKFKVIDILNFQRYGERKYKIKLENPKIGILFYDYDPTMKLIYPFKYGVATNKELYCSQLTREIDKFTNQITIYTPILKAVSFTKIISKKIATVYISINIKGSTLNAGEHGATILFSNGKKLLKPNAKISVDPARGSGWNYSVFIPLTQADIKFLTENTITDAKLYIYDDSIENGEELKELLKCMIKAK